MFEILKMYVLRKLANRKNDVSFSLTSRIKSNCNFEGKNKIMKSVVLANVLIGFGSYIARNSNILNTNIGRFTSIGSNVSIIVGNHPTSKFVSTHPVFFQR